MKLLRRAFTNEIKHFDKLSKQGQTFLLSIFLYNVTHPVFAVFINAFIWRQSQDVTLVALYNLGMFCMLPVGFYLNGHLLKKISVKRLYFFGAVLKALTLLLLLATPKITDAYIIGFGMTIGFISGLYWSNRNLLTVKLTDTTNRIYFSSLDFLVQTLCGILIPILIGTFIVFGSSRGLYTPMQGYYMVIFVTICITLLLSILIRKIQVTTPHISSIIHRRTCFEWKCSRGMTALYGLVNGIIQFLPILLVLNFLGQEDTLGIVQSIAAVVTGCVLYLIARTINNHYRVAMIAASIAGTIASAALLAFAFSPITIFIFVALFTLSQQVLFTEGYAIIFDLIDRENTERDQRYAYVFDTELFLNTGRVVAVLIFLMYCHFFTTDAALRYTPLIFGVAQIAMVFLATIIEDRKSRYATIPAYEPRSTDAPPNP